MKIINHQNLIKKFLKKEKLNNIALIDGQNLYMGVTEEKWKIDYEKMYIYLKDKYKAKEIYYFLGYSNKENESLYKKLKKSGYIIKWKSKGSKEIYSEKKGNVDTNIVFFAMHAMLERKDFNKFILISGDGDYIDLVKYLIKKKKFEKIIFPNKKRSSHYKKLGDKYTDHLKKIKSDIEYLKKRKG